MPLPTIHITGMGLWSAAGTDPAAAWHSAQQGLTPARWREFSCGPVLACTAPDPEPCPAFPQAHRMDRSTRMALAAALPAFRQARLHDVAPDRIAVLVGNSRGPASLWESGPRGGRRPRPTQAAHSAVASLSGALSIALQAKGPCLTVSATCASAAHAIALGAGLLLGGTVDAVLAGGAEAPLVDSLVDQFRSAGLLGSHARDDRACRPFDLHRNGMIPGEGAAFLVLERADLPRQGRPAALGTLLGWSMTAESHNRVAARPDGEGLARALRQALAQAGLAPQAIDHLNAHGTGTRVNDAAEAAALRTVFGDHLASLAVSSTKPVTGHTFGAAAALEAILTLQALRNRVAPPTVGFDCPDPDLALQPVSGPPRPIAGRTAISTSLGFWGNAAALVFGPAPDVRARDGSVAAHGGLRSVAAAPGASGDAP